MTYFLKKQNNKYYILSKDSLGNTYETFHSCPDLKRAKLYIQKFKTEDKLGYVANCDLLYKKLDLINEKLGC
jgi:hypothetical protein